MGLGKVIGWGFLALVLFGITALMLLGLVFGITTKWVAISKHPPSILATSFWFALLFYGDYWATKKLRVAYARYKFEKAHR
jgi:hypothetical protein